MLQLLILSPCFYLDASPANLMVGSARRNGLAVRLYGIGKPFIPHGADAQVFQLWELMKAEKLAEYALITDCRDVLFCASEWEIIRKFKSFYNGLVMSSEKGCWPLGDKEIVDFFYGKSPHGYDYVNAGQYIGNWEYIVSSLEHLLLNYRGKDGLDNSQAWWMRAKMRGELDFKIDSCSAIFQTTSQGAGDELVIASNRVENTFTNTSPCSIHFNGNPSVNEPHREMYERLYGNSIV